MLKLKSDEGVRLFWRSLLPFNLDCTRNELDHSNYSRQTCSVLNVLLVREHAGNKGNKYKLLFIVYYANSNCANHY